MKNIPKTIIGYFIILAVTVLIFQIWNENFLNSRNIRIILDIFTKLTITSMGLTFVLAVGKLDLSFHFIGVFGAMTTSYLISQDASVSLSVGGGILAALAFGLVNGIAIGRFELPDLITTIGTGAVAFGLANFYSEGSNIYSNFMVSGIMDIYEGRIFGISHSIYIISFMILVSYLFLHRSIHGRYIFAIGQNRTSSFFSGIKTNTYIATAYAICSVYAFIALLIITSAQGSGRVDQGSPLLFPTFAIAFLGIVLARKPSIIGTALASLLVSVLIDGMSLIGLKTYVRNLMIGLVLLAAIVVSNETIGNIVKSTIQKIRFKPVSE